MEARPAIPAIPALSIRSSRQKCRLMGPLRPFRGCGIWSKDHPRARADLAAAHDPPKCGRFGVKIMRSFIGCERDRTQNRPPLLLIAPVLDGRAACAPLFSAQLLPLRLDA